MLKLYEYIIKFFCIFIPVKNRRTIRTNLLMLPNGISKNLQSIPYYRNFSSHRVTKKSVLIIEPNSYHFELMPGFCNYFQELKYHVDVISQPDLKLDSPFINYTDSPTIYYLSPKYQKKSLKLSKIKEYDFVFLNTSVLWSHNIRDSYINWLGYEPNAKHGILLVEHNIIPYVKEYGHEKYIEQNRSFTLKGQQGIPMLNPHYFGKVKKTKKSQKTIFSAIVNEKQNVDFLFSVCRNLIKKGITNFEIIITGRTVINKIPEDLLSFLKITGKTTFDELWKTYENADFIISMLNSEINSHKRYKESTTTGTWQIMLGFLKPTLIHVEFASYYHLNETNSIIYSSNLLLEKAIIESINMSQDNYEKLQININKLADTIYEQSLSNLKKSIDYIQNKTDLKITI